MTTIHPVGANTERILTDLADDIAAYLDAYADGLDDADYVRHAADFNQILLDAQAAVALRRRNAVRRMRTTMTLREIAEATGLAHQRISQIERGMDRKEK